LDETFTLELVNSSRRRFTLLDNEQDWIEKYRAALVQPAPGRRLRLAAALHSLAKTLGFAIGKTSGKLANPAQGVAVSGPSPQHEVQDHPRREQSVSKKPSPPEHRHDKKAS